jgi:hypothetical protein
VATRIAYRAAGENDRTRANFEKQALGPAQR